MGRGSGVKETKKMSEITRNMQLMAYRIGEFVRELKKGIDDTGITGTELYEATNHLEAAEDALLTWTERHVQSDMKTL